MKKIFFLTLLSFFVANTYSQSGCVDIKIKNSITNTTGDFTLHCIDSCVTLKADITATGLTADDYTVESIPFNPPYAFNTGTPIMIGQDDIWDGPTTLPFDFCFYGNIYNQACVGANGLISFNLFAAGNGCAYDYNHIAIPNPSFVYKNAIYGVYEDIHPTSSGQFTYRAVLGTHPCRTFVVNWNDVPLFPASANQNNRSTYQIVLYENSNIIDVYVLKRSCCSTTNLGDGIIGIQNQNGTQAKFPANRNLGTWTTEQEAWRFKPVGDPQYTLYWKDEFNNIIGVGDSIIVCPSQSTRYYAAFEYESCNGDFLEMEANVNIRVDTLENIAQILATFDTVCHNQSIMLTANGGNRYLWDTGETTPSITVTPNGEVTYSVRTYRNHCHSDASKPIHLFDPSITVEGSIICSGETGTVTIHEDPFSIGGPNTYLWSDGSTGLVLSASPTTTTTYSVTCTNARGCQSLATADIEVRPLPVFTITESTVCKNTEGTLSVGGGTYSYLWSNGTTGNIMTARMGTTDATYSVTVTDTSGCIYVDSATIHVYPDFTITTVGSEVCKGETGTVTVSGADSYVWSDGTTGDVLTGVAHNNTTYTVTGTDINGCPNTATGTIKVRKNPVANFMASSYKVQNDAPPVNFYDQSTGDPVTWDWDFGDGHQSVEQNPTNQYTEEGFYTVWLRVEDTYGCSDSVSRQMRIIPPFSFFVPNSFSPDGDGINEVFKPVGEGSLEADYEMLIYDRWGKLIFRSNTPYDGWDGKDASGKPLPMGMYVYTVNLYTPENEHKTYQGEVMLVR